MFSFFAEKAESALTLLEIYVILIIRENVYSLKGEEAV